MNRKNQKPDFSGWATVYGKLCGDGRVIKHGAFDDMDGREVPLVYQHNHGDVEQVVGRCLLHSVRDGIRCDGFFNNSAKADCAREAVDHEDLNSLSIWANDLSENAKHEVSHGTIREVSLVLSGANPDARIDYVSLSHGSGPRYDEAIIYNGVLFDYGLQHDDTEEDDAEDVEEDEELDEEEYDEDSEEEDDEDYDEDDEECSDEEEEDLDDEDYDEKEDDENGEDDYDEDNEPIVITDDDIRECLEAYNGLSESDQEIFNIALANIGGEDITKEEYDSVVEMLSRQPDDVQDELLALIAISAACLEQEG